MSRQLSLPVSTMSQWRVSRSTSAVVFLESLPNTLDHSPKSRLVVIITEVFVELADEVEEELAARAGERQVAELVQHHEVQPGELAGEPVAGTGIKAANSMAGIAKTRHMRTIAPSFRSQLCRPHACKQCGVRQLSLCCGLLLHPLEHQACRSSATVSVVLSE